MDYRDAARYGRADGLKPDPDRMVLLDTYDELGELPGKWSVCPTCEGKGKHVNPSIDSQGLSAEDFDEDPDFREDYVRGVYDVVCYECGGRRVVLDVDRDAVAQDALDELESRERSHYDYLSEVAAERRMGC